MAKLTLTIYGVTTTLPSATTDVSISLGDSVIDGKLSKRVSFLQKNNTSTGSKWEPGGKATVKFILSMGVFNYEQKMYNPDEIIADILLTPESFTNIIPLNNTGTASQDNPNAAERKVDFTRDELEEMFANKKVKLTCANKVDDKFVDFVVGSDFYVQEVVPRKYPDKLYVTLKIYSLDKLLTLQSYCRNFTAQKLSDHILKKELLNYQLPFNKEKCVESDTSKMKHLLKDKQEHIFPYLAQYNESFYDLLARTTNRWGEFMYYYNGKLTIGYDADETKAVEISDGYKSITYRDCKTLQPAQLNAGPYSPEATYDSNVLNSVVRKDSAEVVKNTIANALDMEKGADVYWMTKASQLFATNKSLTGFVIDTAINDIVALAQTEAKVYRKNSKLNEDYFDKKKNYISTLDEQYGAGAAVYNQFSEATPILNADVYKTILQGEEKAAQSIIDIDFDTKTPNLHLGQLIKVDGKVYIVTEIKAYQPEIVTKVNDNYYERGVDTGRMLFRVSAIAQVTLLDKDKKSFTTFYPTMIPSGHVRTSGPQVALVVDVDDPNRTNRVRVMYPWQLKTTYTQMGADDVKKLDLTDASPWLLYASSSGPSKAGVHGRHYLAEKVLVDYADGNVERPFVVGAVSTEIPVDLKTSSSVLMAPNGEKIKVHEGTGLGANAFVANLNPGLKLMNSFVPFNFLPTNDISKRFEGGVEMSDRYGIWSIKCSSDSRNVSINSTWGDVKINAFTGITISAPNGDIKLSGKNVTIEAGNNLKLVSGKNIKNKFISWPEDSVADNAIELGLFIAKAVAQKIAEYGLSFLDLSYLRCILEIGFRPMEGTLQLTSNRFLKLGAGGCDPGFPSTIYEEPYKVGYQKLKESDTVKMGPAIASIIGRYESFVESVISTYLENYKACMKAKKSLDDTIKHLKSWANTANDPVCSEYKDNAELLKKLWSKDTKEIKVGDLSFTANVNDKDEGATLDDVIGRHIIPGFRGNKEHYVRAIRRELKMIVVNRANNLMKRIQFMKTKSMFTYQAQWNSRAFWLGTVRWRVPKDFVNAIIKSFSAENCKLSSIYLLISPYDADGKELLPEPRTVDQYRFALNRQSYNVIKRMMTPRKKKALARMAAVNLLDAWGINGISGGQPGQKFKDLFKSEADYYGNKWYDNIALLDFTNTSLIATDRNFLTSAVSGALDKMNVFSSITDYYVWGDAKKGQILYSSGKAHTLGNAIGDVDADLIKGKIGKNDLLEKDKQQYAEFIDKIKGALRVLGGAQIGIPAEEPQNIVVAPVVVPQIAQPVVPVVNNQEENQVAQPEQIVQPGPVQNNQVDLVGGAMIRQFINQIIEEGRPQEEEQQVNEEDNQDEQPVNAEFVVNEDMGLNQEQIDKVLNAFGVQNQ